MHHLREPQAQKAATKRLRIQKAGGGSEFIDIQPGTRVSDVLQHLGLSSADYEISAGNEVFSSHDMLYGKVEDGDALFATARVDAG
jgi:hypothetical protein